MKRLAPGFAALTLLLGTWAGAEAGLVYDNGPVSSTLESYNITGFSVSNSFTVSAPTTLSGVQAGLVAFSGDAPVSVDWSIGSTAFGTDVSSGTASLSNTYLFTDSNNFAYYESIFSIGGTLAAGTYYLTLGNGASTGSTVLLWDQSGGPSLAFESELGRIGSESFQIYGSTAVPEPSSMVLCGIAGLAGLAGSRARGRRPLA